MLREGGRDGILLVKDYSHIEVSIMLKVKIELISLYVCVFASGMAGLYQSLCHELGWDLDEALLNSMHANFEEKIKTFDEK